MCGICGTINLESGLVDRMNTMQNHRGPDSGGVWKRDNICLGHTRLTIIDVSEKAHQPMSNEDKTLWLTFNGEIYNFKPLRAELERKGHIFSSQSDTEVIIHLYEDHQENCVSHLRGMFAFALWDEKRKRLFAARDRLGIKPFFYWSKDQKFIFASELKAILATRVVDRDINSSALNEYFLFGAAQAPQTLIRGIVQLLPGHCLVWESGILKVAQYWDLFKEPVSLIKKTQQEYAHQTGELLRETIKLHMVSDVPMGAFLSGGVDSSIIVGLMQQQSSQPVKTFSVTFKETQYDESQFSNRVARLFGTDHTQISLSEDDIIKEIPGILDAMDQPSPDGFNTFIVSKAVRENGIKVALSGLGGDELFAGYPLFKRLQKIMLLRRALRHMPQSIKKNLLLYLNNLFTSRRDLKMASLLFGRDTLTQAYMTQRMIFLPHDLARFIVPDSHHDCASCLTRPESQDLINDISALELTCYLRNTLLQDTDRMSMAHSLEVRVPFLDHVLVEELFKIPGHHKVSGTQNKKLLLDAAGNFLPRSITSRPKKGFVLPFDIWLKKKLYSFCAEKLSPQNIRRIPYLNTAAVDSIWNDFQKQTGRYNYSSILTLLSFVNWYEKKLLS